MIPSRWSSSFVIFPMSLLTFRRQGQSGAGPAPAPQLLSPLFLRHSLDRNNLPHICSVSSLLGGLTHGDLSVVDWMEGEGHITPSNVDKNQPQLCHSVPCPHISWEHNSQDVAHSHSPGKSSVLAQVVAFPQVTIFWPQVPYRHSLAHPPLPSLSPEIRSTQHSKSWSPWVQNAVSPSLHKIHK